MSSRQFTPSGGTGEIVTLDDINEYDDLPPLAEIDSPDVYEIRTGNLATDYFVPIKDGSTDFNVWYSLVDGQIIRAISDIAVHHWPMDEGSGSTITDNVGSEDGTLNGPSWVSNSWQGGFALDGDGTDDYIETGTWGSFGSNIHEPHAVLFTVETTTDERGAFFGITDDNSDLVWRCSINVFEDNVVEFQRRDDARNTAGVYSSSEINDGEKYRVVINIDGPSESDMELYLNANEDTNVQNSGTLEGGELFDFPHPIMFFAREEDSPGPARYFDGVLDNIIVTNDSLSEAEIEKDYEQQPWS